MRIFVGGSFRGVIDTEAFRRFVAALGQAVVERGRVLLNGCRNPVDKEIAEAANRWLVENKRDPKRYLISYWQRNVAPAHKCGTVRASALPDWKMSRAELRNPRIENGIARSAFVLADITDASSNVFFEVGFARGCGKPLLVTAEKGTELPFDLADLPVLFWENRDQLREGLNKRIAALKERLNPSGS